MNRFRLTLVLALMGIFLTTNGCKKDKEDPIEDLGSSITVFTNQTGEPNETAKGLQAQVIDNNNGSTVDFYGGFSSDGNPDEVNSIRVSQTGSDTVVSFILDPVTKNFDRAVLEVNGQKLNLMVKFDFPAGDTSMVLSHYDYNWTTGESELLYAGEYFLSGGAVNTLFLASKTDETQADWGALAASVGVGVAVAEGALALGVIGGASLVGAGATAVVAAAGAVGWATITAATLIGTALVSLDSEASDVITPQNVTVPENTPPSNTENEILPEPTPVNPCLTNRVEVIVGVDPGNTLVAIAQGGTYGPYDFYWSDGSTGTGNPSHSIQVTDPGTYYATAVDENNCSGSGSATLGEQLPGCGIVTDIDGNQYNSVTIGNQCWMKENLKVTKYQNGDDIPNANAAINDDWSAYDQSETGVYVYPAGDIGNNATFGKTYTGWVAIDERNVCPVGWHVPSKIEWQTLTSYLGGEEVAGGKMKAAEHWLQPNVGADNSSGFTAFPSFIRDNHANYWDDADLGSFWSSTHDHPTNDYWTWSLNLDNSSIASDLSEGSNIISSSIRCVKD